MKKVSYHSRYGDKVKKTVFSTGYKELAIKKMFILYEKKK